MQHMLVGPALIVVNRNIIKDLKFKFPMFISGLGLVGSALLSVLLIKVFRLVALEKSDLITCRFVTRCLAPIGLFQASTLAFGNAAYIYIPIGLIQILKSFTPAVTLVVLVVSGTEMPTTPVVLSVLGICAGMALATGAASEVNLMGVLLMFGAESCEATRLVLQQRLLQQEKFGIDEAYSPCLLACLRNSSMQM